MSDAAGDGLLPITLRFPDFASQLAAAGKGTGCSTTLAPGSAAGGGLAPGGAPGEGSGAGEDPAAFNIASTCFFLS